jgi:signal transduction histidine kinase
MLRRARVAIVLGASITIAFIVVDMLRIAPEKYPEAVAVRVAGALLLLFMLPATQARNAVEWSGWLAGGALAILLGTTAAVMPLFGGASDPQYAIQGTGLVLCVLGAGLLLPFDAPGMLAFGLLATALHVGFTFHFPLAQNLPVVIATLSAVLIAVVGARELTRSRRADFEGRRAKEELMRARSDFVAMLTHDIKNPLSAIDGLVEMLRDERGMAVEERETLLDDVQRAVRTAISLAANFLDASKIEAGRLVLKTRTVDLVELLDRALDAHRPHALQKAITLANASDANLPGIEADGAALERVFANLIGNAIKHTPRGGTVRLAARPAHGSRIEIVVEDSGEGITPGQETRIFERYTGAASRADSTGLGLFIARTITVAHGGTISAENRRDGVGARFRIILPIAAEPPVARAG